MIPLQQGAGLKKDMKLTSRKDLWILLVSILENLLVYLVSPLSKVFFILASGVATTQRSPQMKEMKLQWNPQRIPKMRKIMRKCRMWSKASLFITLCHHLYSIDRQSSLTFTLQLKIISMDRSFLNSSIRTSMLPSLGNLQGYDILQDQRIQKSRVKPCILFKVVYLLLT